jgi:hypothetical protein
LNSAMPPALSIITAGVWEEFIKGLISPPNFDGIPESAVTIE